MEWQREQYENAKKELRKCAILFAEIFDPELAQCLKKCMVEEISYVVEWKERQKAYNEVQERGIGSGCQECALQLVKPIECQDDIGDCLLRLTRRACPGLSPCLEKCIAVEQHLDVEPEAEKMEAAAWAWDTLESPKPVCPFQSSDETVIKQADRCGMMPRPTLEDEEDGCRMRTVYDAKSNVIESLINFVEQLDPHLGKCFRDCAATNTVAEGVVDNDEAEEGNDTQGDICRWRAESPAGVETSPKAAIVNQYKRVRGETWGSESRAQSKMEVNEHIYGVLQGNSAADELEDRVHQLVQQFIPEMSQCVKRREGESREHGECQRAPDEETIEKSKFGERLVQDPESPCTVCAQAKDTIKQTVKKRPRTCPKTESRAHKGRQFRTGVDKDKLCECLLYLADQVDPEFSHCLRMIIAEEADDEMERRETREPDSCTGDVIEGVDPTDDLNDCLVYLVQQLDPELSQWLKKCIAEGDTDVFEHREREVAAEAACSTREAAIGRPRGRDKKGQSGLSYEICEDDVAESDCAADDDEVVKCLVYLIEQLNPQLGKCFKQCMAANACDDFEWDKENFGECGNEMRQSAWTMSTLNPVPTVVACSHLESPSALSVAPRLESPFNLLLKNVGISLPEQQTAPAFIALVKSPSKHSLCPHLDPSSRLK